jgi:hypothetical protein
MVFLIETEFKNSRDPGSDVLNSPYDSDKHRRKQGHESEFLARLYRLCSQPRLSLLTRHPILTKFIPGL